MGLFGLLANQNTLSSFCFLLIGISLAQPYAKIPNFRFRTAQGLAFTVLVTNLGIIMGRAYQLLVPRLAQSAALTPLSQTLTFVLLSLAVLLRWPGRGIVGIFTTQSLNSLYALRLLIISMAAAPFIGAFSLLSARLPRRRLT